MALQPLTPTSVRNLSLLLRSAPRFVRSHFQASHQLQKRYSSVSPTEVSHFNALASTWWDPHGSSRLLHLMNPYRHDFIQDCHASQADPIAPNTSLTYLDIGCGGGIFAESAARIPTTKKVTAIDPSPEVLAIAKAHARRDPGLKARLTYINTSIEELPKPGADNEGYDVVTLFEVIEHVTDPPRFLDQIVEQIKPGGWLVMSTIARHWISYVTTKVVAEDLVGIVPKGTHDWDKYINEDEMRGYFAEKGGFNSPRVMGVLYVPGVGWKQVNGSEKVGNYFFAVRKDL